MLTLGIETSCDETSVAVVQDGRRILSNIIFSSLKEHRPFGGVVPEIASRSHVETILPCLERALKVGARSPRPKGGGTPPLQLRDIDLIAVTQGPGLMGSLLVGLSAAKALAWVLRKPLIGVDHVVAHVYAAFLHPYRLKFPFLGLVVSGGHTLIVRMDGPARLRVLGKTIDDAAGEAFDKVAKILGLGYPGGPEIDQLARNQDTTRFYFTRPFLSNDSLDFSFSGIKTAVFYKVREIAGATRRVAPTPQQKRAIAAGFQEAVCEVLVRKSFRAARAENLKTIVVGGGVSANNRLRRLFHDAAPREGVRVVFPPPALCQDNAAMIAALGTALYQEGEIDDLDLSCYSRFDG